MQFRSFVLFPLLVVIFALFQLAIAHPTPVKSKTIHKPAPTHKPAPPPPKCTLPRCCESVMSASDPRAKMISELFGIPKQPSGSDIGTSCTAVKQGSKRNEEICDHSLVCCEQEFDGFINTGCKSMSI